MNLEILEIRRIRFDFCFIYKPLNNIIHIPELLSHLNFSDSVCRSNQSNTYNVSFRRSSYSKNAPINKPIYLVNTCNIDLFLHINIDFLTYIYIMF